MRLMKLLGSGVALATLLACAEQGALPTPAGPARASAAPAATASAAASTGAGGSVAVGGIAGNSNPFAVATPAPGGNATGAAVTVPNGPPATPPPNATALTVPNNPLTSGPNATLNAGSGATLNGSVKIPVDLVKGERLVSEDLSGLLVRQSLISEDASGLISEDASGLKRFVLATRSVSAVNETAGAGLEVGLITKGPRGRTLRHRTRTDANGNFSFPGVEPGRVYQIITAFGTASRRSQRLSSFAQVGNGVTNANVDIGTTLAANSISSSYPDGPPGLDNTRFQRSAADFKDKVCAGAIANLDLSRKDNDAENAKALNCIKDQLHDLNQRLKELVDRL